MLDSNPIRARVAEIERQIANHEMSLTVLRGEVTELRVALAVMARFQVEIDGLPPLPESLEGLEASPNFKPLAGAKPAGTPKMADMITEAVSEFELIDGLEPKEITNWIRQRYWPDVKPESVSPIVWRMWRAGKLVKEGQRYCFPKEETPAVQPASASEPRPVSADLFINPPPEKVQA